MPEATPVLRPHLLVPLFVLALLLPLSRAAAQTSSAGSIIGTVLDEAERPLPGIEVGAVHGGSGAEFRTLTDPAGRFRLINLPAGGPYELTIRGLGIAETRRAGLRLQAGETLRLDVVASAEAVAIEGIEARAAGTERVINPSRTGSATYIDAAAIESVPTLSRNLMELTSLSPLVRRAEGFSIAGQNERYNALRLDGANVQDVFGLSPTGVAGGQSHAKPVPLAAVEQYQILVSPFEVRHSGFTGGLMNAVTRSGTNEWKGEVFTHRRDERLVGDFSFDGEQVRPAHFLRQLHGGALGGPLARDRLHIFLAAEVEERRHPTPGLSYGDADPRAVGIHPDSVARLLDILETVYGIEGGTLESVALENPLFNAFGRLDWHPRSGQRLSLRLKLADAGEDIGPLRHRAGEYGLSSTAYRYSARTRSATLQWNAQLASGVGNELLVHLQRSRERNEPESRLPFVQVDVWSHFESIPFYRLLEFGARPDAHASRLKQDVLQIANQLTFGVGGHEMALGVGFDRHDVRHVSAPGALGAYRFASLRDLEQNIPSFYQRRSLAEGAEAVPPGFILYRAGGYLQDEWSPAERLRVQAGMRVDVPILHDLPDENTHVRRTFGVGTTDMPSSFLMISPRVGVNWHSAAARRTQLRGGMGVFAGQPPLAWLAQAYDHTGLEDDWLICPARLLAPRFDPGEPLPAACNGQPQALHRTRQVVVVDRDFRFPQELRATLGIDQELPGALIGSLEWLYTRAYNQVHLMDLNIGDRREEPLHPNSYPVWLGRRSYFGPATSAGFTTDRVSPRYEQVLLLTNRALNQSFTLTGELQRAVGRSLMLRGAYAFTRSFDTQSLSSADLAQSFARTAISGDPNDPGLRPSHYDQPHKVVLSASAVRGHRLGDSRVALVYTGQSGTPYSYVYLDDVNGDGYPGRGVAIGERNDLIYVPGYLSDLPMGVTHMSVLHQLIEMEPCLREAAGWVLLRNSCRTPFSHLLDVRTSHGVRLPGGFRAEVTADLINALNFFNPEWGHVYRAPSSIPLLAHRGRRPQSGLFPVATDPLEPFYYVGPLRMQQVDGRNRLLPARAYAPSFPESQWQAQLGLRVTF